jgi:hypothetical protein
MNFTENGTTHSNLEIRTLHKLFCDESLAPSSTPTGAIAGTIIDDNTSQPIVGATVTITPGGFSVTTDDAGNYDIPINVGTYTVTASASGYNTESVTATVSAGLNSVTVVRLPPISNTASQGPSLGVPSGNNSSTTQSTKQTSQNPIEKSIEKKIVDSIPGFDISIAVAVLILLVVGLRTKKER